MGQRADWPGDSVAGAGGLELPASQQTNLLASGHPAPNFCLPDADMETFELEKAWREGFVVLHFFLHDSMPLSVKQAISFSDHEEDFRRCGARVVGVSLDDCLTHAEFRDEHGLALQLVSDEDGEACRLYRVWQKPEGASMVRPTVHRASFVVGLDGMVLYADYKVDVRTHVESLLEFLKTRSGRKNGNRKECRRHA